MEVSPIDFCNTFGFILKNNKDKSKILLDIKNNYNVNPLNTNTIIYNETNNHLSMINKFPYISSFITRGNKFLMYFTKLNGDNIVLMIDRKIKNDNTIMFPKIISICIQGNNELFNDTLLETETILEKNEWTIQICDVIVMAGNYCYNMNIFDRINTMFKVLNMIKLDKYLNPYKIKIKEFIDLCNLNNLSFKIENGLYFHPINGNHKTIEFNLRPNTLNFSNSKELNLLEYDIKKGLEIQLNELKSNINNFKEINIEKTYKEIVAQVETTNRYGLFKVSILKGKELVEIGNIRFSSLENKEEFYKLITKYKTIRLILKYDYNFMKWVPIKIADKLPFTTYSEIENIINYQNSSNNKIILDF